MTVAPASLSPTCVYRMYDEADRLLYVGVSGDLPTRLNAHRSEKPWYTEVSRITLKHFPTRDGALDAETHAIAQEGPLYNRTGPEVRHSGAIGGSARLVAAALRARIVAGEFAPGTAIPSERDLVREYDATRPLLRDAIRSLREEGILVSRHGAGTYVRGPARRALIRLSRPPQREPSDGADIFASSLAAAGLSPIVQTDVAVEVPPQSVAKTLGIDIDHPVVVRRKKVDESGETVALATGYLLRGTTAEATVMSAYASQGEIYDALECVGQRITAFQDALSGKAPSRPERDQFGLDGNIPLISMTRVALASGRAVEVTYALLRSDRFELEYPAFEPWADEARTAA